MLNSIKNSFKVLLNSIKNSAKAVAINPALVLFPVIYIILLNVFLILGAVSKVLIISLLLFVCAFLFTACFVSGWFEIVKKAIKSAETSEKLSLLPVFFEGVGKNIIPVGLGMVLYTFLTFIGVILVTFIATKAFGSLDFVFRDLQAYKEAGITFAQYFKTLPNEKAYIIYGWQISFVVAYFIYNFLMTFFFPALVEESDKSVYLKPLISVKNSVVFVFKNLLAVIACYFAVLVVNCVLSIIENIKFTDIVYVNSAISLVLFLLHLYFGIFMVVLIFNYYENNRNYRGDSIRENESSN